MELGWFAGEEAAGSGGVEFGGDLIDEDAHGIDVEHALAEVGGDAEAGFGGAHSYEGTLLCRETHGEGDDAIGRLHLAGDFWLDGCGLTGGLLRGNGGEDCRRLAAGGGRFRLADPSACVEA